MISLNLNPIQNRRRKYVHSGVNLVGDELRWLFNELVDGTGLRVVDHDAVFAWFLNFCHLK